MPMHMYVWSIKPTFMAVAQAASVEEARAELLKQDELGESGDGSCPERDEARRFILGRMPLIWHGPNAEFVLTDSAELREHEQWARNQIKAKDAEVASLRAQLETANVVAKAAREWREAKKRFHSAVFQGHEVDLLNDVTRAEAKICAALDAAGERG